MTAVLMFIAFAVGVWGILMASKATAGVAVLSFSCLIAILGRIAQADGQHKEMLRLLTAPQLVERTSDARPSESSPAPVTGPISTSTRIILAIVAVLIAVAVIGAYYLQNLPTGTGRNPAYESHPELNAR